MKQEKKHRRGFFGRLIAGILAIMAVVGLIAMCLSVLSSFVNPEKYVWIAYFGLVFWVILIYNLIVFTLLLLMWSRHIKIALLALLIAIPGIVKSFSTGKSQGEGDLRVMTYNVHYFEDKTTDGKTQEEMLDGVIDLARQQQVDVFCVQEIGVFRKKVKREDFLDEIGQRMGLPYIYYQKQKHFGSNVIFSKYPVVDIPEGEPFHENNDYGVIVTKIDAGEKGEFYVACCHLTSFQLTDEELKLFSEPGNTKEEVQKKGKSILKQKGKSILTKMDTAYCRRSNEVSQLLSDMPHDGRNFLICGDMNDTPLSYTYQRIKKAGFIDSFVKVGRGIGYTYAGKLPWLRIDYIWYSGKIQPKSFVRLKHKGSDHYPIIMSFSIDHGV